MDSGTTTYEFAKHLNKHSDITVITNDINITEVILRNGSIRFSSSGYGYDQRLYQRYLAKQALSSFSQIDMYVFSCDGVTIEDGFTTSSLENNELKRMLAEKP